MISLRYFAALAVITAAPANAADFTFDVPVRVENMPYLNVIYVRCSVTTGPGGIIAGANSRAVPLREGRYEGTIVVEVENEGLIPSESARSYRCGLEAVGTSPRTGRRFVLAIDNFIDGYQSTTGQAILTAHNRVNGPIP